MNPVEPDDAPAFVGLYAVRGMADHRRQAPRITAAQRRLLRIPYPLGETLTILQHYARRKGIDIPTAAEALIALGAAAWLRFHRGGRTSQRRRTPEQRRESARIAGKAFHGTPEEKAAHRAAVAAQNATPIQRLKSET